MCNALMRPAEQCLLIGRVFGLVSIIFHLSLYLTYFIRFIFLEKFKLQLVFMWNNSNVRLR